MSRVKQWIKLILDDVKPIETCIIALSLWWAFILALPMKTFNTSPSYRIMAHIAPEQVWAGVFMGVTIIMLLGMVYERFYFRMVGLIASAFLWIFLATMFAVGNIATTGTGTYFIVFCLTTYVIYKVGEHHGR
jgi:hypothetical protein